ncbi:MAG: hypothetical protein ACPLW9_01640 [Minisyncoccales bacterium]
MLNKLNKQQKASFLLYVVFIVSLLLVIAFGLTSILLIQIKMLGEIGYSVGALYAADAGIEQILMQRRNPEGISGRLSEDISYEVSVKERGSDDCQADHYCIKSIGTYKGVKRAIEVEY